MNESMEKPRVEWSCRRPSGPPPGVIRSPRRRHGAAVICLTELPSTPCHSDAEGREEAATSGRGLAQGEKRTLHVCLSPP